MSPKINANLVEAYLKASSEYEADKRICEKAKAKVVESSKSMNEAAEAMKSDPYIREVLSTTGVLTSINEVIKIDESGQVISIPYAKTPTLWELKQ